MPQVLRPRQPEPPRPPEPPKPEAMKRPDPPKPPEAPTNTQDGLLSRFGKHWKEMSIFARIMFTVGLFGVVFYGIRLVRVAVGTAEFETGAFPAWIYFLYFLLMVSELFQLLRYEGFAFRGLLGTVCTSLPGEIGAEIGAWGMLFFICCGGLCALILSFGVYGRDVVFPWGGLACCIFQFIWSLARAFGCLKEEKSKRK